MTTIRYSLDTIRKLKDSLPRGSRKIIRLRTVGPDRPNGYNLAFIWAVLDGRKYNQEILDIAFEYAAELKDKIEQNSSSI